MFQPAESQRAVALNALFQDYCGPAFSIRFWNGWKWSSSIAEKPACTIILRNPKALSALVVEPNEIALGEAFIHDDLDVEGDIFSVFSIGEHLLNRPRSLRQKIIERAAGAFFGAGQLLKHGSQHSQRRDQASIAYHYDQPIAFYEPWLGSSLAYSCAYFRNPDDALDLAQEQKLELICRKLRLQPLESFLDIGCGWGSLLLHAASRHHVHAQGITISKEQAEVAKQRIELAGMQRRCTVELRDYRTLECIEPSFDKIASVGMFEHVGLKKLPQYFRIVHSLLRPGGTFLNHGIARSALSPTRKSSFIDRYVFPDGQLVTLTQALEAAESQGLEVRDVENLREHYELTLRRWVEGLTRHSEALLQHVSEVTYRIWLLYMAGSAAAFRRGDIAVYQVLLTRSGQDQKQSQLTREDWYSPVSAQQEVEV
jgi:cyclopropane-fatty-acyl-phospholipid synthase